MKLYRALLLTIALFSATAIAQVYPFYPPPGTTYDTNSHILITLGTGIGGQPTTISEKVPASGGGGVFQINAASGASTGGGGGSMDVYAGNAVGPGNFAGGSEGFVSGSGVGTGSAGAINMATGNGGTGAGTSGGIFTLALGSGVAQGGPGTFTAGSCTGSACIAGGWIFKGGQVSAGATGGTGGPINFFGGNATVGTNGSGGTIGFTGGGGVGASGLGGAINFIAGSGASQANSADLTLTSSFNQNIQLILDRFDNIYCHDCSNATNLTDGFWYVPVSAGVPNGVPAHLTATTAAPIRYNTSGNQLYVYNSAWQNVADLPTTLTAPTGSGCTLSAFTAVANTGGAQTHAVGAFTSGTTGTCTVTITLPAVAHSWACRADDLTTPANFIGQSATSTNSCVVTGTTVSGDAMNFIATGF